MQKSTLIKKLHHYRINADTFENQFGLCKTERFKDQYAGGFCSGSLVGEDLVITAGHCITNQEDCKNTKFVFNYAVTEEGTYPETAEEDDVVGCASIVARKQESRGADFAVIRLDRKITRYKPLAINRADDLKAGDPVGVIGYPSGLPVKISFGESVVRTVDRPGFFMTNLDTYGGNSGSAVFNTETGLIEGILVRGENDFVNVNGCFVSNRCPATGCRGEDVTKIGELANLIPDSTSVSTSRWPTRHRRNRHAGL